ncbi:hypothetical protein [Streptomyces sp. 7N604]|uniref:hypothetical protein n=1 Tax=Streptomyces sp. 7N604 TaxID=3457415 RepID=UPI003FD56C46
MEAAILILALLFLAFVVLGAYVTVKVVGAAKRGVDRTVAQARRTVEDTTLRARQLTQPGPVGQLAELRLSLRTSMRATQDALYGAPPEDASLSEARGLFERLSAHGRELDGELKRLEQEPDKGRLVARLPELRERTRRLVGHADSLRWAAQDRAQQFADDDLSALGNQIEVETGALRHWTTEADAEAGPAAGATNAGPPAGSAEEVPKSAEAGRVSGATEAGRAPGPAAPAPAAEPAARPSAATPPAATPTPTWPDVSMPDAASQEPPPAITARDPRQQTAYPWEKAARRPESTT